MVPHLINLKFMPNRLVLEILSRLNAQYKSFSLLQHNVIEI